MFEMNSAMARDGDEIEMFGDLECSMKFGEVQRCSVIN